jgi:hypothetical protein
MTSESTVILPSTARPVSPWSQLTYTAFLLVLMLAPQRQLHLYYLIVTVLVVGFSINRIPRFVNRLSIPFLLLTGFLLFGALVRSIAFSGGNARDYLEVARFFPVILVFATPFRWRHLRIGAVVDAALAYLAIDAVISVLQITGLNPGGLVTRVGRIYSSSTHLESALGISGRALGLSSGPGQHGAILFVITVVSLYGLLTLPARRIRCLLGFLVGLVTILLAQSQTAFVVTAAVVFGLLCVFLVRGDRHGRRTAGLILAGILGSSAYLITVIAVRFHYLFTLFVYGLGRSSYQHRQEKWADILGRAFEQPWWLPLGWGKDYFGRVSGAMDSDLLYIFSVYGAIVFAVFLILLLGFLWNTLRKVILRGNLADYRVLLFALLLGGLVFSWPSAFFTSPNILVLLALVYASWWWESQEPRAPRPTAGPLRPSSEALA